MLILSMARRIPASMAHGRVQIMNHGASRRFTFLQQTPGSPVYPHENAPRSGRTIRGMVPRCF